MYLHKLSTTTWLQMLVKATIVPASLLWLLPLWPTAKQILDAPSHPNLLATLRAPCSLGLLSATLSSATLQPSNLWPGLPLSPLACALLSTATLQPARCSHLTYGQACPEPSCLCRFTYGHSSAIQACAPLSMATLPDLALFISLSPVCELNH